MIQHLVGLFVEVEDRADTDRNTHLLLKVVTHSVIGQQLKLRHIDCIGLDADAILNRPIDPVRKSSNKSIFLVVFNNLCSVFSHESRDINIVGLPCFITVLLAESVD